MRFCPKLLPQLHNFHLQLLGSKSLSISEAPIWSMRRSVRKQWKAMSTARCLRAIVLSLTCTSKHLREVFWIVHRSRRSACSCVQKVGDLFTSCDEWAEKGKIAARPLSQASFMIEAHLRQVYGDKKIKTQADALSWLGGLLRVVAGLPNYYSDERVGKVPRCTLIPCFNFVISF